MTESNKELPLQTSQYTLHELLCMDIFMQSNIWAKTEIFREILVWAEYRVMAGDDSEFLLILASLGIEAQPDRSEIEKWLELYLAEQNIVKPKLREAALIWLRIWLDDLFNCGSLSEAESRMGELAMHWFIPEQPFFVTCLDNVRHCYWRLFDDGWGEWTCVAAGMGTDAFFEELKNTLAPWRNKLSSNDWITFLTSELRFQGEKG